MDKQIFWIASYPKSGNTLLRSILSSIFFTDDGLFDFKLLKSISIIESAINLEFIKKINISDYNNIHKLEILSKYWIEIQSKKNLDFNSDFLFIKTHHALVKAFNNSFTNKYCTRGIIYIVRDPRDVVISYAHHYNSSIENTIQRMLSTKSAVAWDDNKNIFLKKKKPLTVLSSWDLNCESWIENSFNCPFLLIKYEDMISSKMKTIKKLISFFEKNYNFQFNNIDKKIENIIQSTNFNLQKKNEDKFGFPEAVGKTFFRKGTTKQWENILSKEQVLIIEKKFHPLMKKFGYKSIYYEK